MFTRDRTCPLTQEKWKPSHVEDEAPKLIGFTTRQKWLKTRQCLFICANRPKIMFLISESNLIHFLTRPAFCTNHIMLKNFCHRVSIKTVLFPLMLVRRRSVGQVLVKYFSFYSPLQLPRFHGLPFNAFYCSPLTALADLVNVIITMMIGYQHAVSISKYQINS